MALLFWDSFDHYATANILEKWTYLETSGFCSIAIGAVGRHGTSGLNFGRVDGRYYFLRRPLLASPSTVIMGASVRHESTLPSTYDRVWSWLDNTTIQLSLRLNNDGSLEVLRGGATTVGISTSGACPYPDVHYYIEMKALIDGAAGTVEVKVNGVTVINEVGANTQQSANAQVTQVQVGGTWYGANANLYFDDLYVCDDTGGYCDDFLGDTWMCMLLPEGVGTHADWTPSAGANWQCVDDNPPNDDTDYNLSGTATDRDSFEMEDLPAGIAGTVHAVCAVIDARKDEAGIRTIQPSLRSGGVDYDGTGVNVPNNYAFHILEAWETDPDTAAPWIVAGVNAVEAGYELSA